MQILQRISPGKYALPDYVTDADNIIIFYNGVALTPGKDYTIDMKVLEIPYSKSMGLVTDVVMMWSMPPDSKYYKQPEVKQPKEEQPKEEQLKAKKPTKDPTPQEETK